MDNLSWDDLGIFGNEISFPEYNWSNIQLPTCLNTDVYYRSTIGKVPGDHEVMLESGLKLQGIEASEATSDLPSLDSIMESINCISDPDHEAVRLPMFDSTFETFGIGSAWGDTLTSQLCSLPRIIIHQESQALNDTHDVEDGASTIFSSSKSNCNLTSSGNLSSGEALDNHDFIRKNLNVGIHHPIPDDVMPIRKRKFREYGGKENCNYYDLLQSSSSTTEGGFQIVSENSSKRKKPKLEKFSGSSSINFCRGSGYKPDAEAIGQVKEMIYRAAALRPVNMGLMDEPVEKTKRKNVKISSDPQTVAARHRRERISERLRILQRLVPGGSKMDTASMLDEAANYLKFLKSQVSALEAHGSNAVPFPTVTFNQSSPMQTPFLLSQNPS